MMTLEQYLGLSEAKQREASFIDDHIESRRNAVRVRASLWRMPLERIARMLNLPLAVVESDIDWLAERGLI
ncbi:hypothetical protein SAVIM338S_02269 [Streptomyces avidinii]